jgi:hypothetical protein
MIDREAQAMQVIAEFVDIYHYAPDSQDIWRRMWLRPTKPAAGTLNFVDTCRTLRRLARTGRVRRLGRAGGWQINEQ